MGESVRTCRDGHRCLNGSQCAQDPNDEGSYYCDCSTAQGDYAGLYCEYEAEVYCNFPQEVSDTWFCTNGATCVVDVSPQASNFDCDCAEHYVGPHCEFVKGAIPDGWPDGNKRSSRKGSKEHGDGLETGIKAVIIVVVVVVVALISCFIIQKRRVGEDAHPNAPKDQAEALQIDADGEVLQEAVKSLTRTSDDEYDFETAGIEVDAAPAKSTSLDSKSNRRRQGAHFA